MLPTLQRLWYRRRVQSGPMAAFLETPLPDRAAEAADVEYLALDLETTGLDPGADAIVSIGCVPVVQRRIRVAEAAQWFVKLDRSVAQSATIHHIRDADLDGALDEREALTHLLQALAGRVMLVHHAPVETGFLNAACRRHFGAPLPVRVVDTLALARRRRERAEREASDDGLRLDALRQAHRLPRYPAHDALTDALATAELFLAMLPEWDGAGGLPLKTVLG